MKLATATLLSVLASSWSPAQAAEALPPAGFAWPAGRAWSSANDQGLPCGSPDGPGARTQFPLTNGAVSLQISEKAYKVNLAISYNSDPNTNSDFETLVPASSFPVLEPGNECYSVPNPQSNVLSGQTATLQLAYAVTDGDKNKTHYSCADIIFVPLNQFSQYVPCYNYTQATGQNSTNPDVAPTPGGKHSGKKHLSGGAIAGIVIGIVVAFMLVAGYIIFRVYRKMRRNSKIIDNHLKLQELKRNSANSTKPSDIV